MQCGPLGDYLELLSVDRLDFVSIDVEGMEHVALQGLRLERGRLSIGVLLVEVRGDGGRPLVMATLLGVGFTYVGQVHGRPSWANEIIDDVFVNMTHLKLYFPQSRVFDRSNVRVRPRAEEDVVTAARRTRRSDFAI